MPEEQASADVVPVREPTAVADRRRRIADLVRDAPLSHFAPYRGGYHATPVAVLPEALLVYRVENGRLIAELQEHALAQGLDLADLRARQDSPEVQQLLHRFLALKAADPAGPILQELAEVAQQIEPLLITADGVLINGNRRLAAMRELLRRDPERYGAFRSVSAAVLPSDVATADIEATEAALQMAPETKLAYGWINRRLKLRRQRDDLGLSTTAIQQAYRLTEASQIDVELEELDLVDVYLSDLCDAPGRYSLVEDAELLFVGLRAQLAALPARLRGVWKLAGLAMIHGRRAVQGPMDRHFPFAQANPGTVPSLALLRFAEEQDLAPSKDEAGEIALEPPIRNALIQILSDPGRSEAVAVELYRLMEQLRAELQDRTSPVRTLHLLEKLRDTLARLDPQRLTAAQRHQVRGQVAAIQAQVTMMLDEGPTPASPPTSMLGKVARLFRR